MGIIIIQDGYLKYFNNAFCELTGYSCDAINKWEKDEIFNLIYHEDVDFVREKYLKKNNTKSQNNALNYVCRRVTKKNKVKWMELWSTRIKYERKEAILVTFIDVDERMKAEQGLKESETRLKLALQSAKQGLWDWNITTNEIYFSNEWIEMVGYSEKEVKENIDFWFNLIHPNDLVDAKEKLEKHISGEEEYYKTEYRIKTKSGKYIWVLDQGQVVERDSSGKAIRAVGIQIDITYQKENEEKLKELNITKDKFFSIIAHDLKNPFNQFIGLTKLLLEGFVDFSREELFDFIKLLSKISDKTNNLLENLLEWSRSQTGSLSYNPIELDMKTLIINVISLFENQLHNKEINIKTTFSNNLYALADENMIKSVFRNLISNAIKYTPKGGEILIEGTLSDKQVEILIIDEGVGIKAENLENLFRLDIQYTTEGTDNEKGTGLGLVLCKEFIEMNGGLIQVESTVGEGSKFKISLPVSENK